MANISDIINQTNLLATGTPSSSFAFHGLKTDANGLLTYTRALFANTQETVTLTDGAGFAYTGMEELVRGTTDSGVVHNTIYKGLNEVGDKALQSKIFYITVKNNNFVINLNGYSQDQNGTYPNRELQLVWGATYTFNVNDPSTQGYPIFISTQPSGGTYANEYLKGVVNSRSEYGGSQGDLNALSSGPLQFTVPSDAPSTLYLASGNHTNVFATLNIGAQRATTNLSHRAYSQVRFDNIQLYYYIDGRGNLVARYNNTYNYTGPV
jgi:hypothetical protein